MSDINPYVKTLETRVKQIENEIEQLRRIKSELFDMLMAMKAIAQEDFSAEVRSDPET